MDTTTTTTTENIPWTLAEFGTLEDRIAVVTGGSSGIGFALTGLLASRGARVLIGARDHARARAVAERLRARSTGPGTVEAVRLDLADLDSVRAFAGAVADRTDRVDLLVNNAGISNQPFRLTPSGVEQQFAVNHLGHFALTGRLVPLLAAAQAGRVVTVSSALHSRAHLDLAHLGDSTGYDPGAAYIRSKLANALFAVELDRRTTAARSAIRSAVAHPGLARTEMHDTYPSPEVTAMVQAALAQSGREPEDAITGIAYAAAAPDVRSDLLYGPGGDPMTSPFVTVDVLGGEAVDAELAAALWRRSAAITGIDPEL